MSLSYLLGRVPDVYATLEDTMLPGRSGEASGPRPVHSPAPARLDVVEHRHKLLRGLRWWVDAVDDGTEGGGPIGESVARMAAYLLRHSPIMAQEDRDTLTANLREWLGEALTIAGGTDERDAAKVFPPGAADAVVPQATAARLLGVPVSTVWRRNGGKGGAVRLGDVSRCDHTDLPVDGCAHCALSR